MPLFEIAKGRLGTLEQTDFDTERRLHTLIESNLGTVFNCRHVASEFNTGTSHAGRIDTLALSEDDNPVIIEYKKVESSDLINQSLFYLAWMEDHHGDFEIAVQRALGSDVTVDWSDIRVICIAPNFRKYDLHAVQVMGANIELWQYRLFRKRFLYLQEVFRKSYSPFGVEGGADNKTSPGKKPLPTRKIGRFTFEHHLNGKPKGTRDLALAIQEFVMGLDPAMEEVPRKVSVAYKISQNIVCMVVYKKHICLYLKLDPKKIRKHPPKARDVTNIGHYGTGDFQMRIENTTDFERAKPFIEKAYRRVGG